MLVTTKSCEQPNGLKQHLIQKLLYCTGEMQHFHTYMQDQPFLIQLLEWLLRGVSGVIMVNNPLSGALILTALSIASPWDSFPPHSWQSLLDRNEVSRGEHGYNGMLVALLIGVFSSAGDWYWWLLLPACLAGATTAFLYSGLAAVLDRWDLPVSVIPFNTVLLLYLACTGIESPYYPNYPALSQGPTLSINNTHLSIPQLVQGAVLGVGQIYACDALGSSLIILSAVLLYSPVLAFHALMGSILGILAGISVAVQQEVLYTGLAGFNGALGCMAIGGLLFTLSWRTHVFSIICAFLSSYANTALSNLLAHVGLPASSWASTLTINLMLLVSGRSLSTYRIAVSRDNSPGESLQIPSQCFEAITDSSSV